MFCPKCGQQQLSDEVRFCSRCGLALMGVAGLFEADGQTAAGLQTPAAGFTARQRGTRKGLLVISGGFAFVLLTLLLTAIHEDFFDLLPLAALVIFVGLMRTLYAVLLEDDAAAHRAAKQAAKRMTVIESAGGQRELPPAHSIAASEFAARRRHTGHTTEIDAQPPSVTEGTTRLLEEERDRRA